jgi:hypothetical protein
MSAYGNTKWGIFRAGRTVAKLCVLGTRREVTPSSVAGRNRPWTRTVWETSMSSRSIRRIAATVLAVGAALGAAAIPASADNGPRHGQRDQVEISRVQHDSPGFNDRSLNKEWVDITNNSRRDVNLSGWTLSDRDGHTYTFRHYRLDGHSTVRVHTGFGHDTRHDLFQDRRSHVWNFRDTATLRDNRGHRVDDQSWGQRDHRR